MTPDEIIETLRSEDWTSREVRNKAADLIQELTRWKAEAMQVLGEMDVQAVGRLLELPLGASVYSAVEPGIRALKDRLDNLPEKLSQALWECSALRNGLLRPSELKPFMKKVIKHALDKEPDDEGDPRDPSHGVTL